MTGVRRLTAKWSALFHRSRRHRSGVARVDTAQGTTRMYVTGPITGEQELALGQKVREVLDRTGSRDLVPDVSGVTAVTAVTGS